MRSSASSGQRAGKVRAARPVARDEHFVQPGAARQPPVRAHAPVVEVAGDDQRRVGRHLARRSGGTAGRAGARRCALAQAQVHADRVHVRRRRACRARSAASPRASSPPHRDIVVAVVDGSGSATAARCRGRHADRPRCGRRHGASTACRPGTRTAAPPASCVAAGMVRVRADHFLQEDDVGGDGAHRLAQLMQDEAAVEEAEALVRVQGQHTDRGSGHGARVDSVPHCAVIGAPLL